MEITSDDGYNSDSTLPDLHGNHLHQLGQSGRRIINQPTRRNGPLPLSRYHTPDVYRCHSTNKHVENGRTYCLKHVADDQSVEYFHVQLIIVENVSCDVTLRGWKFKGNGTFEGQLPAQSDEVCLVLEVDRDDNRPHHIQAMETIKLADISHLQNVTTTNKEYPAHCVRGMPVCRWASKSVYATAQDRARGRVLEVSFAKVEVTSEARQCFVLPHRQLKSFCGRYVAANDQPTFVDAFCGAGGASEGARRAGFKVIRGIDICPKACATYRLNHAHAEVLVRDVFEHIWDLRNGTTTRLRPDVLHISCPCKAFSAANTQVGRRSFRSAQGMRDEQNQALIFCVAPLLEAYRPRFCTMEQTNHIVTHTERNEIWFVQLIQQFTTMNYSVRWKIVNFVDHGSAQERKRLMLYAAAPGETLPEFPDPTYGPGRNLPFKTIQDAIGCVRPHHTLHNLHEVQKRNGMAYSSYSQLSKILTGGGTEMRHPSGLRDFTLREMARLAGFPLLYKFNPDQCGGMTRLQIGNTVPADGFATLCRELKKHVLECNKRYRENARAEARARLDLQYHNANDGVRMIEL